MEEQPPWLLGPVQQLLEPQLCALPSPMQRANQRAQAAACLPRVPGPVAAYAARLAQEPAAADGPDMPAAGADGDAPQPAQQQAKQQAVDETARASGRQAHPSHRRQHQPHLCDLPGITRTGDILVVAVGYPHLVRRDWVKPGAVVIDVGINVVERGDGDGYTGSASGSTGTSTAGDGGGQRSAAAAGDGEQHKEEMPQLEGEAEGRQGSSGSGADPSDACCEDGYSEEGAQLQHPYHVVGDVDFCDVAEVAAALTPVPGGVGPMTIAAVLHNTVQAARHNLGLEH